MRTLTADDVRDFLAQPLNAILATHWQDGRVLLSPVWHEWRDGGFNVLINAGDVKDRQLRRDPHASIIVAEHGGLNRSVEVRGIARVSYAIPPDMPERITLRYLGPVQTPPYLESLAGVKMALVRLEPGDFRAWDFAGDPHVSLRPT